MYARSIENNTRAAKKASLKRSNLLTKLSRLLVSARQKSVALYAGFGVLLLLVILLSTVSPSPFFAIAIVVALIIGLVALLRPSISLQLVFIGAGLPTLLVPIPGHTVRPIELALLLCLLVIVLRGSSLKLRLPHFLALLFLAIAFISFLHVPEIAKDLNSYGANKRLYGVVLICLAFFCGTFLVKYIKNASSFLVAVLFGNLPLYFIGLFQAVGIKVPSFLESSNAQSATMGDGRVWGPTPGAVIFGSYLLNLFAIALACWMYGKCRRDRIVGAIMTIATALEIVGTGTRGSAIAAGVMLVTAFILLRRFKTLFITLAMTATVTIIYFNTIISRFAHDPNSADNRIFLAEEAIKLISTHPWIGIGLEQFHYYYAQLIIGHAARMFAGDINVHQQYLEWGMESGIFWMIVGIVLLVSIFISCSRAYRIAAHKQRLFLLAAILAVLANIIAGFFDAPLSQVEGAVFFFLLVGLAIGYAEQIRWGTAIRTSTTRTVSLLPFPVSLIGGNAVIRTVTRRAKQYIPDQGISSKTLDAKPAPTTHNGTEASSTATPNAQKTSRTIIIQLISWGIAIPIIFPVTALLTRYLGPTQYGEYSFTFPFFGVFALLSGTGMDPLIIRQLSRQKRVEWSKTLSYALGSRLFSTALSAVAAALIAFILPVSAEQRILLLLGSVALLFSFSFNGMRMIFSYGFRAEQRAGVLFFIETTNRIVTAGLVLLIVSLHLSIIWAYCLLVYSDIPFFIAQVIIARRRYNIRLRFNVARMREHLIGSLSMTGYDALALINGQVDVLLLLVLAGPLSVGIYALAMRITDPLLSIAFAYFSGVYPLLCKKFEEGKEQFSLVYQEAIRILALGVVPLTVYVSIEADTIVSLLGGPRFAAAATAVRLLMCATAIAFLHGLTVRTCTAANLERKSPYITAVSTGTNVIVNLLLIPRLQFTGAAIAAVASELVGLSLYSLLLRRHVYLLRICSVMSRVLLGNIPMLAFLLWQKQASLLLTSPIAVALCIVGCAATRVISTRDIAMVRGMLFSRRSKKLSPEFVDQPTLTIPRIEKVFDLPTLVVPRVGEVSDLPTLVLPRIEEFPDLPTLILTRIEI